MLFNQINFLIMKIKLNQELKGVDNKSPIIGERNEPLTLRNICINADVAKC